MSAAALSLSGVSVRLGGRSVLHDVSAIAPAGSFVGLVGPNGAGKTTLMRTILGLLAPESGAVLAHGHPPVSRELGYVPQRHAFAWDFPISVRGAVLSGRTPDIGWIRRARAADHAAAADALDLVGMSELRDRPVAELSGGQRQRVLVARALARRPSLLLLDEPFTGLDMPSQESLTALFRSLADSGHTVFMSTHDLAAAATACDTLWLLNQTIIASGAPSTLTDALPWMRTFDVAAHSPLIRAVLAVASSTPTPPPTAPSSNLQESPC